MAMVVKWRLTTLAVMAASMLLTGCMKDAKCGCIDEVPEPKAPAKQEAVR